MKLNQTHTNARKYMAETLVALGRSYEDEKKYEEAQKAYENCLAIAPFHEEARNSIEYIKSKTLTSSLNPLDTFKSFETENDVGENKKEKKKRKKERKSRSKKRVRVRVHHLVDLQVPVPLNPAVLLHPQVHDQHPDRLVASGNIKKIIAVRFHLSANEWPNTTIHQLLPQLHMT